MLGVADGRARSTSCPTDAVATSCSSARPPRPTSTCCARARARGVARRVPHHRRATARPATRAGAAEARARRARATSSASCSPDRTARASSRRRSRLCAQIVAPYPPRGRDRDREPVGQLRVVVPELRASQTGVGVSRAVSARATRPRSTVADYLDYYADDPETAVEPRVRRGRRRRPRVLRAPRATVARAQAASCS